MLVVILAILVYGSFFPSPRFGWETARWDAAQPMSACRRTGEADVAGRSVLRSLLRSGLPRTEMTGAKPLTKYWKRGRC